MKRSIMTMLLLLTAPAIAAAQVTQASAPQTAEQKIASALSAAPAPISAKATIMDWPAQDGGPLRTLRQGTNGWTCLPDPPFTDGNDPMCLDDQWLAFVDAQLHQRPPRVTRIAYGYMIAPGGAWGSNTDPFATGKTATNEWEFHGPHIMMIVPDTKLLDGLPKKADNGGPWVMWAGTPWAHVMIPVSGHP